MGVQDVFTLIQHGFSAVASPISVLTSAISVCSVLVRRGRTYLSLALLIGGCVATTLVVIGIVIALTPSFSYLERHIDIGNGVAGVGAVVGFVWWLATLYISSRLRQWWWFGAMLGIGILIFGSVLLLTDVSGYLTVGVLPAAFGAFGPQHKRA